MRKPVVSVLMLTYNHEKFVEQALNSVLSQVTNFAFEVVIGDDVSSDNTRKILTEYKKKFPEIIRLLFNKKNIKPTANFMQVYNNCSGKYIAILEGDDYWTSVHKLQKQVDFLEQNPDCSSCFHATAMINTAGKEILRLPLPRFRRSRSYLTDLIINESFMASSSTMFRNKLFGKFPEWLYTLTHIADLPVNILNAEKGAIGYIDENMSVYRWSSSSTAFSAQSSITTNTEGLKMLIAIDRHFHFRFHTVLIDKICRNCFILSNEYYKLGKHTTAYSFYTYYATYHQTNKYISLLARKSFPLKLLMSNFSIFKAELGFA